jgi:PAS domain S-box-containing protein
MHQPADILEENERLRNRLQQVEDVVRAFRSEDVDALIDQHAASAGNRLRVSEIRYRRLFEAAHDGILIVDPGTREIIDANPFMINLLGYSLAELVGMEIFEIGLFSDAKANKDMFQTLKATGQIRYENLPLQTEDGALREVEVVANRYDENGHSVIQFNIRDTTERSRAEVERAQAENRLQIAHDTFRDLVDHSPFGIYAVDADFRLVQVSDGAQKVFENVRPLLGRDFAEVLSILWLEPFASEAIGIFRHTLATGKPYRASNDVEQRADIGDTEAYDWKIERHIMPDGRPGVVCHFYDLSEKQQQEDRIKLLMGEVNHRSKNMLGLIQAIARQTVKTHPEDFLETFGQRVRALSASQDLLVKGEWRAVQLGELIRSQLAHFGDEHDGRITVDGPWVQITASASQSLGMAVHELATNAAKFGALSNQSGRVAISWSLQSDVTGQKLFAMSWIESGGPPVAKPACRGFGSTVIDGMLKMSLGCDAEVDFAPTGLVWRIGCPAAGLIESDVGPLPRTNGTAPSQKPALISGRRILVVEDEPLIAMDFSQTLSEADYVVIGPANSVAQALSLLAQFGCDAAVLDVNLGGETSEPIARELIKLGTPFVTTSGYSREQQPQIMQNAPLLGKPVNSAVLIAEVQRCLGKG